MTAINVSGIDDTTGQGLTYSGTETINGTVPPARTLTAGTGLTGGGDLSANRTVSLADTAVLPGSYTYASITVDAQGRLTAASSGTTPATPATTLLSTTTSVDLKTTGNTTLYTVPGSTTVFVDKIIIRLTAASAITVAPVISLGNSATANEIIANTTLTGLDTVNEIWTISITGLSVAALTTENIVLKVQTGATATTATATVYLFGTSV